jgi:hypoxanthine phosphoribosyltransferase
MYTATLHYKPTAIFTPDFYSKEVGTEWIVYPWERKDSDAVQDYLKK